MRRSRKSSRTPSLGLLLVALAACAGATSPAQGPGAGQAPGSVQGPGPEPAEVASRCNGDSFQIDLADMQDANIGDDVEERIEQLRDWIFPILLARLEANDGLEGLLIGNASRPLIRDDALAHVLEHEVGITRSAVAAGGEVVIMVEHGDPAAMQDAVLEAVDQEALHLAASPDRAIVYQYALDERAGYAHVCQISTLETAAIESPWRGFRRATLRTRGELDAFLGGGVDLLSAQCTAQGLAVTGRSRPRVAMAPITAEHIAAMRRPREPDYVPIEELNAYLPELSDELSEWLSQIVYIVENPEVLELPRVKRKLDGAPETREMIDRVLVWKRQHRAVETYKLVLSWLGQKHDPHVLGFSLDPKFRAEDGIRSLDALRKALGDQRRLAALLHAWDVEPVKAAYLVAAIEEGNGARKVLSSAFSDLRGLLARSDIDAMGTLARTRSMSGGSGEALAASVAWFLYEHDAYQCARYDGPLQGTRTGMTMFYTDLLMKIWIGDRFEAAPDGLIPGFESVVGHELSGAYCTDEENEYSHTRAWLGLREEQYAREDAGRVRFAPVATRVFARSSKHGAEHSEEVEANAAMRRFFRWWNAHYARVAAWEPQYELLNQIMKWSVVVQAAALSEHEDCMGFLDQVEVDRSQRFDQWVADQDDLRWRGPVALVHRDDEPTECLPVLRSRRYASCGGERNMVGGVSAGSKLEHAAKPVRRSHGPRQLGRLDVRAGATPKKVAPDGKLTYDKVDMPDGTLRNVQIDPRNGSFEAAIDSSKSQRGTSHSYITGSDAGGRSVTHARQSWKREGRRLDGRGTINEDFGVAHLQAGDVTGPVVRPRVESNEVTEMRQVGKEIAERLEPGTPLRNAVADVPDVKAWQLSHDEIIVELSTTGGGSPRYGRMSSGGGNRGPPGSLTMKVGSRQGTPIRIRLIDGPTGKMNIRRYRASRIRKSQRAKEISQLGKALGTNSFSKAKKLIDKLARDPVNRSAIDNTLQRARQKASRQGKDLAALDELSIRNAFKKSTRSVLEATELPADGTFFYVLRAHAKQYVELASLPPGARPATPAGTSRHPFHAQLVKASHMPKKLPGVVRQGGDEYVLIAPKGQSPIRGISPRNIYIIRNCRHDGDDDANDDATVKCHGRTQAREDDAAYRRYLLRQACALGEKRARAQGVNDCSQLDTP